MKKQQQVELDFDQIINKNLIITDCEAEDRNQVLSQLSKLLREEGIVEEGFYEAIIERENEFPTGLATMSANVAIPHAAPQFVTSPGIAIAKLTEPVSFNQMDKPGDELPVEIVFMLAIKEKEQQVPLIQKLVSAFQDKNLLKQLVACDSPDSIKEKLVSFFNKI